MSTDDWNGVLRRAEELGRQAAAQGGGSGPEWVASDGEGLAVDLAHLEAALGCELPPAGEREVLRAFGRAFRHEVAHRRAATWKALISEAEKCGQRAATEAAPLLDRPEWREWTGDLLPGDLAHLEAILGRELTAAEERETLAAYRESYRLEVARLMAKGGQS